MNPEVGDGGAPPRPIREERRPAALSGWLVRPYEDKAHDFVLTNLSYGGCRLRSEAPLAPGDEVRLNVHHRGAIPAVVRWRNGHGVGLSFTLDDPQAVQKPRGVERTRIDMPVVVRRSGRRSQTLDATDISPRGCRLAFVDVPRPGDWLWVSLPGLEPVEARVRWVEDYQAGVQFVRPIHAAVFDLLLDRWGLGSSS